MKKKRQYTGTGRSLIIVFLLSALVAIVVSIVNLVLFSFTPSDVFQNSITRPITVSDKFHSTGNPESVLFYSEVSEVGWWTPWIKTISRTWPTVGIHRHWCFPLNRSEISGTQLQLPLPLPLPINTTPVGLIYVKSHKASSSTLEGINIALARHMAPSTDTICQHYDRHEFANAKYHGQRDSSKSLLWTFVRHPRTRDVSQVYHFRVSRQRLDPNSDVVLNALQQQRSTQTNYLATQTPPAWLRDAPTSLVANWMTQHILHPYDFIGITERMMESLAVMTLLWNLDPTFVIVLSAKQSNRSGSYDAGGARQTCTKLIPPPASLPPKLATYMNSTDYVDGHWDFLLYHAVNQSLDFTIQALGVHRVQRRTQHIQTLQTLAERICRPQAIFPCSAQGIFQEERSNCYIQDSGCGHLCVDNLLKAYRDGDV